MQQGVRLWVMVEKVGVVVNVAGVVKCSKSSFGLPDFTDFRTAKH